MIIIINSGQKDIEVFCVAVVTYKLTIIYQINDPSAKYINLEKNLKIFERSFSKFTYFALGSLIL